MECIVHWGRAGRGGGTPLRRLPSDSYLVPEPAHFLLFVFFVLCKNCATLEIYHLRRRMRKDAERQGAKVRLKGCLRLALLNGKPADGREPRLKLHHS